MSPGILLVTERLQASGIARVVGDHARWLAGRGHRVRVLAWTISPELSGRTNPVLETLAAAGVEVRDLALSGRGRLVRRAARVARMVWREGFTVAVGHGLLGALVVVTARALTLGHLRVVVALHLDSRGYHREFNPAVRRLARVLLRRADAILAVSEGVRRDSAAYFGIPAERIDTVYNPVDAVRIRDRAREAVALPPGPYLMGMGRLQDSKRFRDLVYAFARVRERVPLELLILGEGPGDEALRRAAADLGVTAQVHLPGFVPNPFPYLRQAQAFALTSEEEGFPLVLLEALALGTPIISSRCRWGPEELLLGGRCGLLYEVGDVDALAWGLLQILDDPAGTRERVEAGLRRVEDFSEQAVMERVEALLLGASPGAP
jgi:glycosyltransferase involved in cell wall biosynthesis